MRLLALAAVLWARAPGPEVCWALNVTVSPGPVVDYLEGDNATLLCHVSQKRLKDSLLAVRWFFAGANSPEALMVKMTKLRAVQYYGNFSRSAHRRRLRLLEEQRGARYRLSVLTLRPADQGQYVCRVQEISKHRNKWTAWSNGSSATEMRVLHLSVLPTSSTSDLEVVLISHMAAFLPGACSRHGLLVGRPDASGSDDHASRGPRKGTKASHPSVNDLKPDRPGLCSSPRGAGEAWPSCLLSKVRTGVRLSWLPLPGPGVCFIIWDLVLTSAFSLHASLCGLSATRGRGDRCQGLPVHLSSTLCPLPWT
ncbi:V-set and transmembrane domain-containing protein 4 isoform X2 [Cavia porcellus]|uniref:V-set and transmembrane domain-containing protein 4 isoform X2 n=1 Tax=Cavia porcellus TaxID=10141 RepID=UPI000661A842|nr:V-set and transmembrane domain-containing protein 4 isoform X2 [Cavia porcellus]